MLKKLLYILLILAAIEVLNQGLILSGSLLARTVLANTPNAGVFVGIFQQLVQAALGIILYNRIFRKGIAELGINARNPGALLRYFLSFALVWLSIIALYVVAAYFVFPDLWASMRAVALPPTNTIIARLLFQAFFPGFGEEILFRGLIVNLLTLLIFTDYEKNKASKVGVIVLSSIYFAVAHIYFTVAPFRITHIDAQQIAVALGCGAFYAAVYLKTRSLLVPFLAHNFANTTSAICGYLIAAL